MELSITARPLYSMRKAPPRVTWPIWYAANLYCLAVSRTAASFDGVTETTARAPRSPNAAASAGASSFHFTIPPTNEGEAEQDFARVTAQPPAPLLCRRC